MNTKYDTAMTSKAAEAMSAMLAKEMNVNVDVKQNEDGSATLTVNNGHLSTDSGTASPKHLSALIDKSFRAYREKGWTFTQPQSGRFTIGILSKVTEMDDGYADGGYKSMTVELPPVPTMTTPDGQGIDPALTIGAPAVNPTMDPSTVMVYADSINAVAYTGDSTIISFDVVFTVSCVCPESGRTESYKVVKRIGVDKMKLANDAKSSVPVSIVEAKAPAPQWKVNDKVEVKASAGDSYGEKGVIMKMNSDGTVNVKFKTYSKNVKQSALMPPRPTNEAIETARRLAGLA